MFNFLRSQLSASYIYFVVIVVVIQSTSTASFYIALGHAVTQIMQGVSPATFHLAMMVLGLILMITTNKLGQFVAFLWSKSYLTWLNLHAFEKLRDLPFGYQVHAEKLAEDLRQWENREFIPAFVEWVSIRTSGIVSVLIISRWNMWVALGILASFLLSLKLTKQTDQQSDHPSLSQHRIDIKNISASTSAGEIRLHGIQNWYQHELATADNAITSARISRFRVWLKEEMFSFWPVVLGTAVSLILLSLSLLNNPANPTAMAALPAFAGLSGLGALLGTVRIFRAHFDYLDTLASPATPILPIEQEPPSGDTSSNRDLLLRISKLQFSYPHQTNFTLHITDLEIVQGKACAIVGENGAGKTTLLQVMLSDLSYSAGQIFRRENLSLINLGRSQEPLPLTLAGNIFPWEDPKHSPESCPICTKLGVSKLSHCTHPEKISGGEKQLVGIARCLHALQRRPGILFLDEPTSSLDVTVERQVMDALVELVKELPGSAVVFVSHRFSTVRRADLIYIMEQGHIIEAGNHADLMDKNGKYATMFLAQAGLFHD